MYPFTVHIIAYKKINGRTAYVDAPVSVEMMRDSGIGNAIMDSVDEKFAELERGSDEH